MKPPDLSLPAAEPGPKPSVTGVGSSAQISPVLPGESKPPATYTSAYSMVTGPVADSDCTAGSSTLALRSSGRERKPSASPANFRCAAGAIVSPPARTGVNATFWPWVTTVESGSPSYARLTSSASPKCSATQINGVCRRTGRRSWSRACRVQAKRTLPPISGQKNVFCSRPVGASMVGDFSGAMKTSVNGKRRSS